MDSFRKSISGHFLFGISYCIIFCFAVLPLNSFCYEPVKTIVITKEDIKNATPKSPYVVNFSPKELKSVRMMEKRHFSKTYEDLDDSTRLDQLEDELLTKIWRYTPKEARIKRLELASTNRMLIGTSLPASMSSKRTVKRMRNTNIDLKQKDDVGLIDGFLRLISPEKYEFIKEHSRRNFEDWEF